MVTVLQIWLGPEMPKYVQRCIEKLNEYVLAHDGKHVIVTDRARDMRGEYEFRSFGGALQERLSEIEFEWTASLVDYARYWILANHEEEYMYYIDCDCYFMKDPFEGLLVGGADALSWEINETCVLLWNGFIGATKHSFCAREVLYAADRFIAGNRNVVEAYFGIGPKFITLLLEEKIRSTLVFKEEIVPLRVWPNRLLLGAVGELFYAYFEGRCGKAEWHEKVLEGISRGCGVHLYHPFYQEFEVLEDAFAELLDRIDEDFSYHTA